MAGSRTLTIIKPDAFGSGKAGKIIAHLEDAGFRILVAGCSISPTLRPALSTRSTASVHSSAR